MDEIAYRSESIKDVSKALKEFHKALGPIQKDKENPFTKSKYATLYQIMQVCRPLLDEAGLILQQYTEESPPDKSDKIILTTQLIHVESGEWFKSRLGIPAIKQDPQAYGSLLTYMRRYSTTTMLGITCVDEDDDGNGAAGRGDAGSGKGTRGRKKPAGQDDFQPDPTGDVSPGAKPPPSQPEQPRYPAWVAEALSQEPKWSGVKINVMPGKVSGEYFFVATGNIKGREAMLGEAHYQQHPTEKNTWFRKAQPASRKAA